LQKKEVPSRSINQPVLQLQKRVRLTSYKVILININIQVM